MMTAREGHGKFPPHMLCTGCSKPIPHRTDTLTLQEQGETLRFHIRGRCFMRWKKEQARLRRVAERKEAREKTLAAESQTRGEPVQRLFVHCPTCGAQKMRAVGGTGGKTYRVLACRKGHFAVHAPDIGAQPFPEDLARQFATATKDRRADVRARCAYAQGGEGPCMYIADNAGDLLEHMMHVHILPPPAEAAEILHPPAALPPEPAVAHDIALREDGRCQYCERPAIFLGLCAQHAQEYADRGPAPGAVEPPAAAAVAEIRLTDMRLLQVDEVVARLERAFLDAFEQRLAHLEHRVEALFVALKGQ